MKNSILILLVCASIVSCKKETISPAQLSATSSNSENSVVQPVVTFITSAPHTVYLSRGLNTLQSDSFSVSNATCYATSFQFAVSISGTPNLSGFKFYINGGQTAATITYADGIVTVAMRRAVTLIEGNYNYILQARTFGESGSSFSTVLSSASIVDNHRFLADIRNLPVEGNTLILR